MVSLKPTPNVLGKRTDSKIGGGGFNNAAAGNKTYGAGRPMPNIGATPNKVGYAKRDQAMAARRDALLNKAKGYL